MKLNQISDNAGANKKSKRVGRGIGSGKGKTSGSGQKGQKSRSGVAINGYEGGQMPIYMRLPKRGFNNIFAKKVSELTTGRIQTLIDSGKLDASVKMTQSVLETAGAIRKGADIVKLIHSGEITAKIDIELHKASASAIDAIKNAKGTLNLIAIQADA